MENDSQSSAVTPDQSLIDNSNIVDTDRPDVAENFESDQPQTSTSIANIGGASSGGGPLSLGMLVSLLICTLMDPPDLQLMEPVKLQVNGAT